MITLGHYIMLSAALFCIGVFGALTRRNAIGILMSLELIFNAVNINMVAFSRFLTPEAAMGEIFTVVIIAVAAAESVIGLAIILAIYRKRAVVNADGMDLLKW
ncbi:MAG TPA: NADH-quinone oxidoreductase subunit NuoK [Candidatus Goldiibacteriota bacterium]|nr:NADH-quinone oxidoreductase subunit NuoK [Candidatus Goldiibacteriota bacterium]